MVLTPSQYFLARLHKPYRNEAPSSLCISTQASSAKREALQQCERLLDVQHDYPQAVAQVRAMMFIDKFATADGRARFVPADIIPANERPDAAYPFVLITGRQLEHWHTGSMTRRASVLDAIEPAAAVSMNPMDMRQLHVHAGENVTLFGFRRGRGIRRVGTDDSGGLKPANTIILVCSVFRLSE